MWHSHPRRCSAIPTCVFIRDFVPLNINITFRKFNTQLNTTELKLPIKVPSSKFCNKQPTRCWFAKLDELISYWNSKLVSLRMGLKVEYSLQVSLFKMKKRVWCFKIWASLSRASMLLSIAEQLKNESLCPRVRWRYLYTSINLEQWTWNAKSLTSYTRSWYLTWWSSYLCPK